MKTKGVITIDVKNLDENQIATFQNALLRGLAKEVQEDSMLRNIIGPKAWWVEIGWDNSRGWVEGGWNNAGKEGIINTKDIITRTGKVELTNLQQIGTKLELEKPVKINRFRNFREK